MREQIGLAQQISTAFVAQRFMFAKPIEQGWDALPEVSAARELRQKGVDAVGVRLFLTFTAAMDRARDSPRLWEESCKSFINEKTCWIFDPAKVSTRSYTDLGCLLAQECVSQRHIQDAGAWRVIAESLNRPDEASALAVRRAIYEGVGDAEELVGALTKKRDGWGYFPLLSGNKIRLMWVRMLACPGEAKIANLGKLPIPVDTHIRKVTDYLLEDTRELGKSIDKKVSEKIQRAWKRNIEQSGVAAPTECLALEDTAAGLDPALWFMGKHGCTNCQHEKKKIPVGDMCKDCKYVADPTVTTGAEHAA